MDANERQLARLGDLLEKILKESERLQRDVARLADRVEAFDDEMARLNLRFPPMASGKHERLTMEDLAHRTMAVLNGVSKSEYDVSAIRAHLDSIPMAELHSRFGPHVRKKKR